jgi:hypothetical protein
MIAAQRLKTLGMSSPWDPCNDRLSAEAYFGGNGQPATKASGALD